MTAALIEPVKVAEFWKNRRGESVRVSLQNYEGHDLVDVRQCFTDRTGRTQATKKGVSISIRRLPELAAAINSALTKARELGLLESEAS